jgi:hypothetical protein
MSCPTRLTYSSTFLYVPFTLLKAKCMDIVYYPDRNSVLPATQSIYGKVAGRLTVDFRGVKNSGHLVIKKTDWKG